MARAEGNVELQHKDNEVIQYACSDATVAGEVLYIAGIGAIVAVTGAAAAAKAAYYVRGVFQFPIDGGVTIAQGNKVYWDSSANDCVLTGGTFFLGTAVEAGTAAGGYVKVDINNGLKLAEVSQEHLDTGIKPAYICVAYASVADDAGTGGTVAVSGALTTDHVQISATTGWTAHTSGGPGVSAYVSAANVVTYRVGGTAICGTEGGLAIDVFRAVS